LKRIRSNQAEIRRTAKVAAGGEPSPGGPPAPEREQPGAPDEARELRRYRRHPAWCIASIADGSGHLGNGWVVNLSWGGLGLTLDHLAQPGLAQALTDASLPTVQIKMIRRDWGSFRVTARVVRARVGSRRLRVGLALHWAEPDFYGFVHSLADHART
jgi:hypothetical protein